MSEKFGILQGLGFRVGILQNRRAETVCRLRAGSSSLRFPAAGRNSWTNPNTTWGVAWCLTLSCRSCRILLRMKPPKPQTKPTWNAHKAKHAGHNPLLAAHRGFHLRVAQRFPSKCRLQEGSLSSRNSHVAGFWFSARYNLHRHRHWQGASTLDPGTWSYQNLTFPSIPAYSTWIRVIEVHWAPGQPDACNKFLYSPFCRKAWFAQVLSSGTRCQPVDVEWSECRGLNN